MLQYESFGITLVPKLSLLLNNTEILNKNTANAFVYANKKERKILFEIRKILAEILEQYNSAQSLTDGYIRAIEKLYNYLPCGCYIPYPGILPAEIYSEEQIIRLLRFSERITLYLTDKHSCELSYDFIIKLKNIIIPDNFELHLIVGHTIQSNILETLCDLLKRNVSISLTNESEARKILLFNHGTADSQFEIINGFPMIPGKTTAKFVKVDSPDSEKYTHTDKEYLFRYLLKRVTNLLDVECSNRPVVNTKGKNAYKIDFDENVLIPIMPFYDNCISSKDKMINGILSGGASHNFIAITVNNKNDLPILSAVCKYCESIYSVRPIPFYVDKQVLRNTDDVLSTVALHAKHIQTVYGGSVLDLKLTYDITVQKLEMLISSFFSKEGINLKLQVQR